MNKGKVLQILGPLLLVSVGLLAWRFWPAQTVHGPKSDTPEAIMAHVRSLNSPLVLINFWASWCQPCKVELPAIKSLSEQFAGQGLKVILISIDDADDMPAAAGFLRETNLPFTTFYKGEQPLKFVSQIYPEWTGAVPASLLMSSDLKILDAWEGDTTLSEFQERVQKHLGEPPHEG